MKLTEAGREELALALVLLKDFKCQGRFDADVTISTIRMAQYLGIDAEYQAIQSKVPPMRIEPRYPETTS